MNLFAHLLLSFCFVTSNAPVRYWPVTDSADLDMSSTFPHATTLPPWLPTPGPRSSTQSELLITSSSCSTMISEFPSALSFFRVAIALHCPFDVTQWLVHLGHREPRIDLNLFE